MQDPLPTEPPAALGHHVCHKFHEVFQTKQGHYMDLPASKISEMMKSNNLDVSNLIHSRLYLLRFLFTMCSVQCVFNAFQHLLLQNAPTQSLLSVVNGILDESVERKNSEIPHVWLSRPTTECKALVY